MALLEPTVLPEIFVNTLLTAFSVFPEFWLLLFATTVFPELRLLLLALTTLFDRVFPTFMMFTVIADEFWFALARRSAAIWLGSPLNGLVILGVKIGLLVVEETLVVGVKIGFLVVEETFVVGDLGLVTAIGFVDDGRTVGLNVLGVILVIKSEEAIINKTISI
jgi:hypothetical protein